MPLTDKTSEMISSSQHELAARGERVLLLAKKVLSSAEHLESKEDGDAQQERLLALNNDLSVVGLISLVDPLRDDTSETVQICRRAGIRFCMVTGDMSLTASSIARSAGIFNKESRIQGVNDLSREASVHDIKTYTARRTDDEPITSLVLSGPEIITLNESQWAQVIAVSAERTVPLDRLLTRHAVVRRSGLCPHLSTAEIANRQGVPGGWKDSGSHRRWSQRCGRAQTG